jgi:formylglycine-generating enzyme
MLDVIALRFVPVPGGEFSMGADEGDEDERPAHRVQLDPFHLSVHAITQREYAEFLLASGHPPPSLHTLPRIVGPGRESHFMELAAPYVWRNGHPPRDWSDHPVTLVTYADAAAYCAWLGTKLDRPVRLPTEAEWERAARGDLEGRRYPWGDDIDPSRANFLPDVGLKRHRGTRPVGSYAANAFGLHDMVGNVWEWVSDWYQADIYARRDRRNPHGPSQGMLRMVRGGSWVTHDVSQLRCAHRHKVPADTYAYSIGFRVAYSEARDV